MHTWFVRSPSAWARSRKVSLYPSTPRERCSLRALELVPQRQPRSRKPFPSFLRRPARMRSMVHDPDQSIFPLEELLRPKFHHGEGSARAGCGGMRAHLSGPSACGRRSHQSCVHLLDIVNSNEAVSMQFQDRIMAASERALGHGVQPIAAPAATVRRHRTESRA